jgi:hypothetical protein
MSARSALASHTEYQHSSKPRTEDSLLALARIMAARARWQPFTREKAGRGRVSHSMGATCSAAGPAASNPGVRAPASRPTNRDEATHSEANGIDCGPVWCSRPMNAAPRSRRPLIWPRWRSQAVLLLPHKPGHAGTDYRNRKRTRIGRVRRLLRPMRARGCLGADSRLPVEWRGPVPVSSPHWSTRRRQPCWCPAGSTG